MKWKALEDLLKIIVEIFDDKKFPLVICLCGVLLFTLGALGVIPGLIPSIDTVGRISLMAMGVPTFTLGAFIYLILRAGQPKLAGIEKYGFEITSPVTGTEKRVGNGFFDIFGSYASEPPRGYRAAIIELLEPNGFVFRRKVVFERGRWEATRIWHGLQSKKKRTFQIVLVGPNGNVLWNYWETVGDKYNYDVPEIKERTDDILTCDAITVSIAA